MNTLRSLSWITIILHKIMGGRQGFLFPNTYAIGWLSGSWLAKAPDRTIAWNEVGPIATAACNAIYISNGHVSWLLLYHLEKRIPSRRLKEWTRTLIGTLSQLDRLGGKFSGVTPSSIRSDSAESNVTVQALSRTAVIWFHNRGRGVDRAAWRIKCAASSVHLPPTESSYRCSWHKPFV